MLPDFPQQNGIAERRIGLVMEVSRTSMIHAATPHFLWSFAVRYAAHQLNLWPHVSLPETSPTLRWAGEVGDASMFRVLGSRPFVRDTSVDKLSTRAIPCVFLGFPPYAPSWQFYNPTSRRVFPSQDVTFDESVPFYRLFPYRSAPPSPPPLFLVPGPPPVDPLPPQAVDSDAARGDASGGAASEGAEPGGAEPGGGGPGGTESEGAGSGGVEPGGAELGGAESEGARSGGAEPRGAEPVGVESGGVEPGGAASRGAEPWGPASSGGGAGALPRLSPRPEPLSPQQQREWFTRRTHLRSGAGGAGVTAGAGATGGAAAACPEGARTRGTGAAWAGGVRGAGSGDPTEPGVAGAGGTGAGGAGAIEAGAGGTGAGGAGAGGAGVDDPGAGGAGARGAASGGTSAGGAVRCRPYFVPLLQQILGVPSSTGLTPRLLCPPPDQSQPPLQPASPLRAPSPYTDQIGGLTERCEPTSRPASSVRTGRRVPRPRPPLVPGTHVMALRPSSVPLRVPLLPPPRSSLPAILDPESDRARAASPTVSHLLATVVTYPLFGSTTASTLVAELVDFAATCHLDYATALVAESESASPPSVGGECALCTDVLEDRQEDFECLAAAVAMDAEMASWKSTSTYVDAFPPSRANIVDGMWIFRVKRPSGSPPAFKARYVARGFSLRQGVDYFQTFSPTPKMTTLRVLLHVAAQRDYDLRRPVYGLRQAPREWHDTLRTTLAAPGFIPSTADPSLFLRTDTSLPPFYVLVSFSASASSSPRHSPLLCLPATRSQLHLVEPRSPPVLYVDNKAMTALCQEHRLEHRTKHIALRYFHARELQQRGQLRLAYVATRANIADILTKALPRGDH
ncbi:unnamed protein product [Closterium sp. NIES-53]